MNLEQNEKSPGSRFSLRTGLIAMTILAIYLGTLRLPMPWNVAVVEWLTIAILVVATVFVFHAAAHHRTYWRGVAITGWILFGVLIGEVLGASTSQHVISTRAWNWVYSNWPQSIARQVMIEWHGSQFPGRVLESRSSDAGSPEYLITYDGYGPEWNEWVGPERISGVHPEIALATNIWPAVPENLAVVGNALTSLALALFGGWLAVWMATRESVGRRDWFLWVGLPIGSAIGILALCFTEPWVVTVWVTFCLASLIFAILTLVTIQDRRHGFWLGFGLVGAVCAILILSPLRTMNTLRDYVQTWSAQWETSLHPTLNPAPIISTFSIPYPSTNLSVKQPASLTLSSSTKMANSTILWTTGTVGSSWVTFDDHKSPFAMSFELAFVFVTAFAGGMIGWLVLPVRRRAEPRSTM